MVWRNTVALFPLWLPLFLGSYPLTAFVSSPGDFLTLSFIAS